MLSIKKVLFITLILGLSTTKGISQTDSLSSEREQQLESLIKLIEDDRVVELADRMALPISRPNPIPDITSKQAFILYYPVLFDSTFKDKLSTTVFDHSNTIDHYTGLGLLNGRIWLNENGNVKSINHSSKKEKELREQLHKEAESAIHESVEDWKRNILVAKSEKHLIRIDLLENNELRFISWDAAHNIRDKPGLILSNGTKEFRGTMGGLTYTFTNDDKTYRVDQVDMASSEDEIGLFLKVYQHEKLVKSYKMTEIK